jgi:hypothetical protein
MTGYGSPSIPARYRRYPRLTKPFGYQELIDIMMKVFAPAPRAVEALVQSGGAVKTD